MSTRWAARVILGLLARLSLRPDVRSPLRSGDHQAGIDQSPDGLPCRAPPDGELAFYRCWAPEPVPLAGLVRVAGTRWAIE